MKLKVKSSGYVYMCHGIWFLNVCFDDTYVVVPEFQVISSLHLSSHLFSTSLMWSVVQNLLYLIRNWYYPGKADFFFLFFKWPVCSSNLELMSFSLVIVLNILYKETNVPPYYILFRNWQVIVVLRCWFVSGPDDDELNRHVGVDCS